MTGSQGTLIQRWGGRTTLCLCCLLLLLHLAAGLLAALLCPELLRASAHQGSHCVPRTGPAAPTLPEPGDCLGLGGGTGAQADCLDRAPGDAVRLRDLRLSFHFPEPRQAGGSEEQYTAWNWRLLASLALHLRLPAKELPGLDSAELEQEVLLTASLDYAPLHLLEAAGPSGCLPSSPWHSLAIVRRHPRTLRCVLAPPPPPTPGRRAELALHCSLHPLFELSVISNSSYILQVAVQAVPGGPPGLLDTNATVSSRLTVVRETRRFHHMVFYTKCFFTPILLTCLVWFMVRLCINDFYVTIHDRLLITAGLAQVLSNVPSEALVAAFPEPAFRLLDPLAHIVLVTALALFWTVFTLDKLAGNEPWERTTCYYWRPLALLLLAGLSCLLGLLYLTLPSLSGPFATHWAGGPATLASLALSAGLAVTAAAFQTCLAVLILRFLCDISIHYPGPGRSMWRLKLVLAYCLLASLLLCLGTFLRLAVSLALHWNTAVHSDPLPFSVTAAGALYLSELAGTNLHLAALLTALSRSPGPRGGDWYSQGRPVAYSPACREEPLHLWDLSARPSPGTNDYGTKP